jgi:SpoIID/LytB domain protein
MRFNKLTGKNKKLLLWLIPAWALASQAPAQDTDLSVRILEKLNPASISIQTPPGQGPWDQVKLSRGFLWVNGKARSQAFWGRDGGLCKIKVNQITRVYPGTLTISLFNEASGLELQILNHPSLDDYVACVSAAESDDPNGLWPEYDKALAALVRLYALTHRMRHSRYDYCDLAHCQLYEGLPKRMDYWRDVAQTVSGVPAPAAGADTNYYFNRNCGGTLDSAGAIWGGASKPISRTRDELNGEILCQSGASFRWKTSAPAAQVEKALAETAGLPQQTKLLSWRTLEKTPGGRNKTFEAIFTATDGPARDARINAQKFISQFGKDNGWRVFPSAWFTWKQSGGTYYFEGRGQGHGVGLCQDGALALAKKGWDWRKILGFYFPELK